jgi:hypothetical protein
MDYSRMACSIPRKVQDLFYSGCWFYDDSALLDIIQAPSNLAILRITRCGLLRVTSLESLIPPKDRIFPEVLTVTTLLSTLVTISQPWSNALSFSRLTQLELNMAEQEDVATWQAELDSAPLLRKVKIKAL